MFDTFTLRQDPSMSVGSVSQYKLKRKKKVCLTCSYPGTKSFVDGIQTRSSNHSRLRPLLLGQGHVDMRQELNARRRDRLLLA